MQCRDCSSDIHPSARKCNKCGSYQDWRQYFSQSALVLSLIVSLLSVSAVSFPVISDALRPSEAEIDVLDFEINNEKVVLVVLSKNTVGSYVFATHLMVDSRTVTVPLSGVGSLPGLAIARLEFDLSNVSLNGDFTTKKCAVRAVFSGRGNNRKLSEALEGSCARKLVE